MTEPDKNRFSTIEEVAKHFAVSISTIRLWVRTGDIPKNTYIKVGMTYRFRIPMIEEALSTTPDQVV